MSFAQSPTQEAPPAPQLAVRVQGLGKSYLLEGVRGGGALLQANLKADQTFWALRGVSFEIAEGERVGIIGRNGAGKSTLLKILSRVITPSEGRAEIRGRVASLLEVGTGFNPRLTGRDNIFLNAALLGLSRKETEAKLADIIGFAEIGRFIDQPIKSYSTGMRARLGFAIAAHIDPDVLMLDEVLSVGDAAFQAKCLQRVGEMVGATNPTLLFVSHSIAAVRQFCDRCIWIERGEVVGDGEVNDVIQAYTNQVMSLRPSVSWGATKRTATASAPTRATSRTEQLARLLTASVLADGAQASHVAVDAGFSIEVDYEILDDYAFVLPTLRFYSEDGHLVFTAVCSAPGLEDWRRPQGKYRSRVHIPAHFMNLGLHRVSIGLNTPNSGGLIRHQVEENALTFWVHEARLGEISARGPYTRVKGAVRPLLDWTHQTLDEMA